MRATIIFALLLSYLPLYGKRRTVPDFIKKEFTNCYQQGHDASRGLFNTGLYCEYKLKHWSYGYGSAYVTCDTEIYYLLFYKDGTVLFNILSAIDEPYLNHQCYYTPSSMLTAFQMAYKHPEVPTYHFYTGAWGIYRVQQDTIVIQSINVKASWSDVWAFMEMKCKIVDRETVQIIPYGGRVILDKRHEPVRTQAKPVDNKNNARFPARLIEYDSIPPSDCWLTREDWLICK